jgi:hypothetical protein
VKISSRIQKAEAVLSRIQKAEAVLNSIKKEILTDTLEKFGKPLTYYMA